MNTLELNEILFGDRFTKRYYLGTFPCDQLPKKTPHTFGLVVNVDKSHQPGLHWQSIFGIGDTVFFFDSYGRGPRGLILSFCKRFEHIYFNAMSHQKPTTSSCGSFSCYHIYQMSRGVPFEKVVGKFVRVREDDIYINQWMKDTFHYSNEQSE